MGAFKRGTGVVTSSRFLKSIEKAGFAASIMTGYPLVLRFTNDLLGTDSSAERADPRYPQVMDKL
jgi:hypothetical protein